MLIFSLKTRESKVSYYPSYNGSNENNKEIKREGIILEPINLAKKIKPLLLLERERREKFEWGK